MGYKRKANSSITSEQKPQEKKLKIRRLFDLYNRHNIQGDGNCLFRAILFSLYGNDDDYSKLRQEICDYMEANKSFYRELIELDPRIGVVDWKSYIQYKRKDQIWGDFCELWAASEMLSFNCIVYKSECLDILHQRFLSPTFPMIYLEFYHGNHYNSLIAKNQQKMMITLNKSDKKNESPDLQELRDEDHKLTLQKSITNSLNEKQKKFSPQKKNDKENKSDSFDILEEINDENSFQKKKVDHELYPQAKNESNAYNEAYQYLRHGTRPKRIVKDSSFKNWVKDINNRYQLQNKATNNNSMSRLVLTPHNKKRKEHKIIPYKNEIQKVIELAHNGFTKVEIKHNGISTTIKNISEMQFYWANVKKDVTEYINNCVRCTENQPIKPIKVAKTILADGPLDRITADCWEIPNYMKEASGNRYNHVLTCVDHFSKFKWTELLPNKTAETMVAKLEYIFNYFGNPKTLQTDNGKEFVNEEVKSLCKNRNINFIQGRPYHPQSQGVVEKINDFVSQSLKNSYSAFLKQKKNEIWDIEGALKAFTVNANRNVHSVTLKVPNRLVLCEDKNEIHEVKKRIEAFYNLKRTKSIDKLALDVGTKVYIIKKVTKIKNTQRLVYKTQKIKSKNQGGTKIRIPCLVEDISCLSKFHVKVKIIARPTEDILQNEVYGICISNLEIAKSDRSWYLLVNSS